jgi:hypothetical protein
MLYRAIVGIWLAEMLGIDLLLLNSLYRGCQALANPAKRRKRSMRTRVKTHPIRLRGAAAIGARAGHIRCFA